jgi:predicted 2-oxoglutarate/Fe(II)-dependent dioxygenase YbiX
MKIKDYIVVQEDAVPLDLCDALLQEYKNSTEWRKATTAGGLNLSIRNVQEVEISTLHVIEKNELLRKKLDAELFLCAGKAIQTYANKFPSVNIKEDTGYQLLQYGEGQFYAQHTDSFKGQNRAVSCSFALNDDYEGGEWGFFDREIVMRAAKGSALMFPSNFMYPHEIMPVTKGTRYAVITWFV